MPEHEVPRIGGGRPSLLTPERQERIISALANGSTRKDSAAYAQIGYSTLKLWLGKGRECAERNAERLDEHGPFDVGVLDDPDWPYLALLAAVEEAESRPTLAALNRVNVLIDHDDPNIALKAATWFLRYLADRKGMPDSDAAIDDEEALREEGFALIEEIRRRQRATTESEVA